MAKKEKAKEAGMPVPDDKWEIENGLRTLMDAEKIKCDPEKMKKIRKLAKKQKQDLHAIAKKPKSVEDLKEMRDEAFDEED